MTKKTYFVFLLTTVLAVGLFIGFEKDPLLNALKPEKRLM